MQAIVLEKIGGLQYLQLQNTQIPILADDEVLIKVEYCGLNHLDLLIIEGKRPGPKIFPHILGSELVGKIVSINTKSNKWKINDRVAVYPWTFCGQCMQCQNGYENICDFGGTFGRTRLGGYAQYITAPFVNLIKIPTSLSSEVVCATLLSAITAYHMIERSKIKEKSLVLINGATGGVGTSAIQLIKRKKCKIICSTSHLDKKLKLKKLNVDYIVKSDTMVQDIRNIYPQGVDYVIDAIGGNIWSKSIELLAKNGKIVFCATTLDDLGIVNIGQAFSRQIDIIGSYGGTRDDLKKILNLMTKKLFTPKIDSIYPLKDTKVALQKMRDQNIFGKILIKVT